ncbi:MAG TPA: hypothetical protein VMB81_18545 [Candidatus Sulfotelmatobacter sp.]|nr:hypothetical protein [Candidatus Sulfotelmatobacter sp.]
MTEWIIYGMVAIVGAAMAAYLVRKKRQRPKPHPMSKIYPHW